MPVYSTTHSRNERYSEISDILLAFPKRGRMSQESTDIFNSRAAFHPLDGGMA